MAIALLVLIVWLYRVAEVRSASMDICFLIDETQDGQTRKRSIEDKLQLARDISRCISDKNNGTKIATIVYKNRLVKLGFDFKSVSDVLDDGFAQILHKDQNRRSLLLKHKRFSGFPYRRNLRYRTFDPRERAAQDSPQTMAFLTAAEVLMADETEHEDEDCFYKVLVISDSNVFPVIRDVANLFVNASVEINAIDLSENGNQELREAVTLPSSEHYVRYPSPTDQEWIQDICAKLVKVPAKHSSFKSRMGPKLLRAKELPASLVSKDAPQYQSTRKPLTPPQQFADLDNVIESDSSEYKWSGPDSELGSYVPDSDTGNVEPEDMTDICKSLHDDCGYYARSGLCDNKPEMRGMKQLCKQTCKFCRA